MWMGGVECKWGRRIAIMCASGGGVDGFECVLTSRNGGLVVVLALVGMQCAARVLKWCTACRGGRRDRRMVLKRMMGVRTTYGRQTRVSQA